MTSYLPWILVLTAACGDNSASIDAGVDAKSIDAPVHPIVGRWEHQPFDPQNGTYIRVFEANHRYHSDTAEGTWFIEGDVLTMNLEGDSEIHRSKFYLSDDHQTLVSGAAVPTTPTAGIVGTWYREWTSGVIHVADTYEYRTDHTMVMTQDISTVGVARVYPGTWDFDDTTRKLLYTVVINGSERTFGEYVIPDVAMGGLDLRIE